jgi:DNA-binding NarL/FixJ family response regulator
VRENITSFAPRARVLIGDDHGAILDRAISLLKPHFEIVGAVSDGRSLVTEAARLQPDVIVLDISMPQLSGIEAARELLKTGSKAKLVFLTMHVGPEFVKACLCAGATGYVIKSRMRSDLVVAVNEAIAGKKFISPGLPHS